MLTPEELATINAHCLDAREKRRDADRFAKARKLTEADCEHEDFESVFAFDQYFSTLADVREYCENESLTLPHHVWPTKATSVIQELTVAEVVESSIDAWGWEDMDVSDLNGTKELQAALDAFTAANASVVSHLPDYSTAIILQPAEAAAN